MNSTRKIVPDAIKLAAGDNVAVALRALAKGECIVVDGQSIELREPIARGHKFALRCLEGGAHAIKYGMPIGLTTESVEAGAWLHVHNLRSLYINNDVDHHEG
jgi:altronate hydrolase